MATRYPEMPTSLDMSFASVEQTIRLFFENLVNKVVTRRDQLLAQLDKIKLDYLEEERLRVNQVKEFEAFIKGVDKLSFQLNNVQKTKQDNLNAIKIEQEKCQLPKSIPDPYFFVDDIQTFLQQLENIGTIRLGKVYSDKVNPVRSIKHKKGIFFLGICQDNHKNIYVCGHGNSLVQIFSKDGEFVREFGKEHLGYCYGITLYGSWAFLSDRKLNAVFKFRVSDYTLECRSERGALSFPRGLTVNGNEELLVADSKSHRIAFFSLNLRFIKEIGKGRLRTPCDVKIYSDKIFVLDKGSKHNVHVFSDCADILIHSMIHFEVDTSLGSKLFWTDDLFFCFDQFGNIVISHSGNQTIQIFTLEGNLLHSIQCKGYPTGVAVTDDNTIVCAMYYPSSVQFY